MYSINSYGQIKIVQDYTHELICARCGRKYFYRGREDTDALAGNGIGICDDCLLEEKMNNSILKGGPLDGIKVKDL